MLAARHELIVASAPIRAWRAGRARTTVAETYTAAAAERAIAQQAAVVDTLTRLGAHVRERARRHARVPGHRHLPGPESGGRL